MNPYQTPSVAVAKSELSKEEFRKLVLEGKTTAGSLAILLHKSPVTFWFTVVIIVFMIVMNTTWLMS